MSSSLRVLRRSGRCRNIQATRPLHRGPDSSLTSLSQRHICLSSSKRTFSAVAIRQAQPASTPSTSRPATSPPPPNSTASTPAPNESLKLQEDDSTHVDWTKSFHGLSVQPFSKEAADVLLAPLAEADVEIKPDGILYLPEIKYRRILNRAFGPGGWGLAPRGETIVTEKAVTREYALLAHGR